MTEWRTLLLVALAAHLLLIWSMARVSARAERVARQRRRDFNRSLVNRRGVK